MTIAIFARSSKDSIAAYIRQIHDYFQGKGIDIILYEQYYQYLIEKQNFNLELKTYKNAEELIASAKYLICLGGDGTMLETIGLVRNSGIPILGVNTGRLGFLSPVNKNDLLKALELLIEEKFNLDERNLIEISGCANCFGKMNVALNEFTIHKKDSSSMINIDTYVNDRFLNSYFSDGLILSTPTGSTAYSLSCGGPIMMPDSDNFILTPIAPHNLTVRPLVISNDKVCKFVVSGRGNSFNVSLDSRMAEIPFRTEIIARKANYSVNLINLEGQHFFSTLRNKMMWGLDSRT